MHPRRNVLFEDYAESDLIKQLPQMIEVCLGCVGPIRSLDSTESGMQYFHNGRLEPLLVGPRAFNRGPYCSLRQGDCLT